MWAEDMGRPAAEHIASAARGHVLEFTSLRGLSVALRVLYPIAAIAYALQAIAYWRRAHLLQRFDSGGDVTFADLSSADDLVAVAIALTFVMLISIIVLLIIWLWRAYSNIRVFGATPLRYGRGWTIGAWFIPIANLVIPKQLFNDVWRGADVRAPYNARWRHLPVDHLITAWWGSFVVSGLTLRVLSEVSRRDDGDAARLVTLDRWMIPAALLGMTSAVLGAVMISRLSDRQHRRASELSLI
jgi:hypothetical protein